VARTDAVFMKTSTRCRMTASFRAGVGAVDVVVMIVVQCILLVVSMGVAWFMLGLLRFDKKLRVMGLFGCTHKTVAMGVPLITAIYEGAGQPLGLYLLPLLVWHPSQLVIGSFLAPRLLKWVGPTESSGELSV
jgi:sodium/bile acid cotransporter 7